jgi:hypothetical protein
MRTKLPADFLNLSEVAEMNRKFALLTCIILRPVECYMLKSLAELIYAGFYSEIMVKVEFILCTQLRPMEWNQSSLYFYFSKYIKMCSQLHVSAALTLGEETLEICVFHSVP